MTFMIKGCKVALAGILLLSPVLGEASAVPPIAPKTAVTQTRSAWKKPAPPQTGTPAAAKPAAAKTPEGKAAPAAKHAAGKAATVSGSKWQPATAKASAAKPAASASVKADAGKSGTAAAKPAAGSWRSRVEAARKAEKAKKEAVEKNRRNWQLSEHVEEGKTIEVPATVPPVGLGKIITRAGHTIRNNDFLLPAGYEKVSFFGKSVATKNQAAQLIMSRNPVLSVGCSVGEIVDLYWEEAGREGIRPDLALAQALVETGYFAYGGDVQAWQHNFCGLGTIGGGVKGAAFPTPRDGVRAHIQHLMAYASKEKPKTPIIDPRYKGAHALRLQKGLIDKWKGLSGTWAMGPMYAEKIFNARELMLRFPDEAPADMWKDYGLKAVYAKQYERYIHALKTGKEMPDDRWSIDPKIDKWAKTTGVAGSGTRGPVQGGTVSSTPVKGGVADRKSEIRKAKEREKLRKQNEKLRKRMEKEEKKRQKEQKRLARKSGRSGVVVSNRPMSLR